jgi:deoxyhypusine synthase
MYKHKKSNVEKVVVKDIELWETQVLTLEGLIDQMYDAGGFTAKHLAEGVYILEKMFQDDDCVTFLSFPASIVATGARGILKDLLKEKLVDVVLTTCGTIDHDLARSWGAYYHGSFMVDDAELHKKGINRLGNIFIPTENYGILLEEKVRPLLERLWDEGKRELSTKELVWAFGNFVDDPGSILYWSAHNEIPVFVPGITDGAFGCQLWMFAQEHRGFKIDLFKDQQELSDIVFTAKKTGALVIGGGIAKHHTIWWNQFREGLDYAVYITTAVEYDGSLSGARVREAISWGKVRSNARFVTIDGDATLVLPLMIGAVRERLRQK